MPHYALHARPGVVTVLAISEDGSREDLNAKGDPCTTADDVAAFLAELRAQGLDVPADLDDEIERAERIAAAIHETECFLGMHKTPSPNPRAA